MTQYDATMPNVSVAFRPETLKNTFGGVYFRQGPDAAAHRRNRKVCACDVLLQRRRGEAVYPGEDRALIQSPKVATYDLQPEMSAYLVTDELLKRIDSGKYDVIILNFANCDMVGHTGVFDAAKAAVEAVDTCVGKVVDAILAARRRCADHRRPRQRRTRWLPKTALRSPRTRRTLFRSASSGYPCKLREGGKLADIAPTMLKILGLPQPPEMTGKSIIE